MKWLFRSIGPLQAKSASAPTSDLLFVGTQSNLLAYDVERNADIFFRDVQDGVNTLIVGKLASLPQPLVVSGGNCSILGYDFEGNEAFWTVTGDNVASLAFCDVDSDGLNELLVGSEDFEIRIFRHEELLSETPEADKVSHIAPVSGAKFSYGLANGTVGVYNGSKSRMWRVKTKNKPTCLLSYDINGDGLPEVISGWSNGSLNVRHCDTGEVICRATMSTSIAGMVRSDYRMDGREELVVCSEIGEVRGYLMTDTEVATGAIADSGIDAPKSEDQKALAELQERKQEMMNELRALEKSMRIGKAGEPREAVLPPNTSLSYALEPDVGAGVVHLRVTVSTDAQIANILAIDLGAQLTTLLALITY